MCAIKTLYLVSSSFDKYLRTEEKLGRSFGSSVQHSIIQGNMEARFESRVCYKEIRMKKVSYYWC